MNSKEKGPHLTAVEAAVILGVSRERVIRMVQRGTLAGRRDPERGWLVRRAAVERLRRQGLGKGMPPEQGGRHG